jgi:hypothetical protein
MAYTDKSPRTSCSALSQVNYLAFKECIQLSRAQSAAFSGDRFLGMFIPLLANSRSSPDTAAAISQVITGGVAGAVLTAIFGGSQPGEKLRFLSCEFFR